jgi:signal transduction histidine kinase
MLTGPAGGTSPTASYAERLRRGLSSLVPGREVSSVLSVTRPTSPVTTVALQLDREARLSRSEPDWSAFTGQPERDALGHGYLAAVHPDERASLRADLCSQLARGRPFTCAARIFTRASGQHRLCALSAAPLPGSRGAWLLLVSERTSTRTERNERLCASEREAELLGTLAEGMLHIVNNALQGAVGYTALLGRHREDWALFLAGGLDKALARITSAGRMLATATAESPPRLALCDLGSTVLEWQPLLADLCPPRVDLTLSAAPGEVWVRCDPQGLADALVHVVRNAVEALAAPDAPAAPRPPIRIRVGQRPFLARELERAEPPRHAHAATFAFIEVRDEGAGIAPVHLPRVYDPFFSTRFIGRGLGLSIVRGQMRQMGGLVSIDSAPARGTSVLLLLPAAEPPAA